MHSTRLLIVVSLLGCAAAPLAAQRARDRDRVRDRERRGDDFASCRSEDWGDDSRARFCEARDTGFTARGGPITVDPGDNGGVRVTGWDRDSVAVTARIQTQAETDAEARELARQIRIETSGGAIRAQGPAERRRTSWSVSFDVRLPRATDLSVATVNGPIDVAEVRGHMELRAHNGPLRLEAVAGDVHAHTINGPLVVTLEGERWDGAGLDGETENGPVVLTLPAHYSARLETGTVNGPMRVDYPVVLQGRIDLHRLSTDLGSGGAPVRVVTTNGPVTVRSR